MQGQIAERVTETIMQVMQVDDIQASQHLRGQLHADSLDFCDIALAIEERFCISIDTKDTDQWETVSDVITTVERKIHDAAATR